MFQTWESGWCDCQLGVKAGELGWRSGREVRDTGNLNWGWMRDVCYEFAVDLIALLFLFLISSRSVWVSLCLKRVFHVWNALDLWWFRPLLYVWRRLSFERRNIYVFCVSKEEPCGYYVIFQWENRFPHSVCMIALKQRSESIPHVSRELRLLDDWWMDGCVAVMCVHVLPWTNGLDRAAMHWQGVSQSWTPNGWFMFSHSDVLLFVTDRR